VAEKISKLFLFPLLATAVAFASLVVVSIVWSLPMGIRFEYIITALMGLVDTIYFVIYWLFSVVLSMVFAVIGVPNWFVNVAKNVMYVILFPFIMSAKLEEDKQNELKTNLDGTVKYPEGAISIKDRMKAIRDRNDRANKRL